jgi:hypothetical protein
MESPGSACGTGLGPGLAYTSWGLPREQARTSVMSWARLGWAWAQDGSWAGEMS